MQKAAVEQVPNLEFRMVFFAAAAHSDHQANDYLSLPQNRER